MMDKLPSIGISRKRLINERVMLNGLVLRLRPGMIIQNHLLLKVDFGSGYSPMRHTRVLIRSLTSGRERWVSGRDLVIPRSRLGLRDRPPAIIADIAPEPEGPRPDAGKLALVNRGL